MSLAISSVLPARTFSTVALRDFGGAPTGAVLFLEGDQVAGGVHAGRRPGVLQEHQRQQARRLAVRKELDQQPREPDRLRCEVEALQAVPRAGRVPLVVDEVEDGQHTVEAISGRHLHKQNFRRLVEGAALVEPTGRSAHPGRGRPAALFRFRREILKERPAPGFRLRNRAL